MIKLSALEEQVLAAALAGDDSVMMALRRQALSCGVATRELTGAGFFTQLAVSGGELGLTGDARISGVFAEIDGLQFGAGFVVQVENGRLSLLEGFSYDEPWPASPESFTIHSRDGVPDLSGLRVLDASP
jgi:hypothetical protein